MNIAKDWPVNISLRLLEQPNRSGNLGQNRYQRANRLGGYSIKSPTTKAIAARNKLYALAIELRIACYAQEKSNQQLIYDFLLGIENIRRWL